MIAARLLPQNEITIDMLRTLIESDIAEGQVIEFKRAIDVSDAKAKKTYLQKSLHSQMHPVATSCLA
jgi:hypothetical protein